MAVEFTQIRNPDGSTSKVEIGSKAYSDSLRAGGVIDSAQQAVNTTRPVSSEVGVVSSKQGLDTVKAAQDTEKRLTPVAVDTNLFLKPGETAQQYTDRATQYLRGGSGGTAKDTTTTAKDNAAQDSVTYINPETEQEQTLVGSAITPAARKALENEGYVVAKSNTSSEPKNPDITNAEEELSSYQKQVADYVSQLRGMLISDADLASEVAGIEAGYNARQREVEDINLRRQQTIKTLGMRTGMRYTGGSGGVIGGIISEEERQGAKRIAELEADKLDAISKAKRAARDFNFTLYTSLVGEAQKAADKKAEEVAKLKEEQRKKNEKIASEAKKTSDFLLISKAVASGLTDPGEIFAATGGNVSFDNVLEWTKAMPKKEDFTLGQYDIRYDAKGKPIAYGLKAGGVGGTTGGGPQASVVPGVGSTYDTSSPDIQNMVDDIVTKVPLQLRNTEGEKAALQSSILRKLAQGFSFQDIVDRTSGFTLQGAADKDLGSALYDLSFGTDIEPGKIASLLNRGANDQAMTLIENENLKGVDTPFAQTDTARAVSKQVGDILSLLDSVPAKYLGEWDGRNFKLSRAAGLSSEEAQKVNALETKLQLLNAPSRTEFAGTAVTPQESSVITGFQPSITDQPETIKTRLTQLRDTVLSNHNEARSQRALPTVNEVQLLDNKARLQLYRDAGKAQSALSAGVIYGGASNADLLNDSTAPVRTDPNGIYK